MLNVEKAFCADSRPRLSTERSDAPVESRLLSVAFDFNFDYHS
jgi:hypothetical protein